MSRFSRRRVLALAAGGALSAAGLGVAIARNRPPHAADEVPIAVRAAPFDDLGVGGLGRVEFLGGLELSSDSRDFGGLSGLFMDPDGRGLLALSDRGYWVAGTLVTENGRPRALADARVAPLQGPGGRALPRSRRRDTESLTVWRGMAYVGIEGVHEVLRFPIGRDGLAARGEVMPLPAEVKTLPENQSFEAVAVVPLGPLTGSLIAIAERSDPGDDTSTRGWFVTGPGGRFTVARHGGYDVTDAAFLPSGDLLILERRLGWLSGWSMRIRRVEGSAVRPGALLDGPTLLELGSPARIDNMEGLAVHSDARGVVLTLISDDNFFFLQKTVLLQFRLAGTPAA